MPAQAAERSAPRPISIAIAALGGQGGGVLADWLVKCAELQGWLVQATSIPGVAQRTGTTVYYIEICPTPHANVPVPILALMPVPGDVDLVIAAELMEAGRAIVRGFVTPTRTTLVASTHRVYAIAEKSALGDGIADSQGVLSAARGASRRLVGFDMDTLANRHGSVISSVLLGAVAGSGVLPFPRSSYEQAIRDSAIAVEANLAGFAAGLEAASAGHAETQSAAAPPKSTTAGGRALEQRVERTMPAHLSGLVLNGVQLLADYQDLAYASSYLDRLDQTLEWERRSDGARHGHALSALVARHLALWMAYEDTIRVADLKTRGSRFARVSEEVRPGSGQLLQIAEFMHPRFEEFCETLPARLGTALRGSEAARRVLGPLFARGRRIQTTGLGGFLLLFLLARARRWRRSTLRYRVEMGRIDAWLAMLRDAAAVNYALACELAECQRLVKGYGDTHARGLGSFESITRFASRASGHPDAASWVRALRVAALADEDGKALAARFAECELRLSRNYAGSQSMNPLAS